MANYQKGSYWIIVLIVLAAAVIMYIVFGSLDESTEINRTNVFQSLNLPADSSTNDVIQAIPLQFQPGQGRQEVIDKVLEIDPNIVVEDFETSFHTCNSNGCFDHVLFFAGSYRIENIFTYDNNGQLATVSFNPS